MAVRVSFVDEPSRPIRRGPRDRARACEKGNRMENHTIRPSGNDRNRPPSTDADLVVAVERLTFAVERLINLFDEFAGAFLNAVAPFGKATDRWGRRPRG